MEREIRLLIAHLIKLKSLVLIVALSTFSGTLYAQEVKNLVFEGGGIRGVAYVGAIKALEEKDLLKGIERVSGTSVGSITATLLAIGCSSEEIQKIQDELDLKVFNDGKGIFIGGMMRTNEYYGWYQGDELRDWMAKQIEEKTGDKDMTFSDLCALIEEDSKFKELYIQATNLSLQRVEELSADNYPNMKIADAVRISSSIPFYFTACFMNEKGEVYYQPEDKENLWVMSDGGFVANYPIHTFDKQSYSSEVAKLGYNPETIGLRLEREEQISEDIHGNGVLVSYEINEVEDYVGAFYNLVLENLNRSDLNEYDWKRTVSISTCKISPKIRKMEDFEKKLLIDAGYNSMKDYLERLD